MHLRLLGITGAGERPHFWSSCYTNSCSRGGAVGAADWRCATGQALEESIEGIAGVSQQTAGEIAKDVAVEFAYGFLTAVTVWPAFVRYKRRLLKQ